jgi:hypothetical protein
MASLTQRDEFAPAMLNRILGGESALHDTALKAVLSTGEFGKILPKTLTEAASKCGYTKVRDTIMLTGVHLCHIEMAPLGGLDANALTVQAAAVWAAACELGDSSPAGLVANLGIAGLGAAFGKDYRQVIVALAGGNTALHQAERLALGVDHAIFGSEMLREVGFSEAVCYDTEHHAEAEAGTEVIAVAEVVAHQMGFDGGLANAAANLSTDALAGFGIVESSMAQMAARVTNIVQWAESVITHSISPEFG